LSGLLCPQCGGRTHRSHANRFHERLIRSLTSYKVYRCHECGWRGWLRNRKSSSKRRHALRTIIGLLVTLLITTLLALYLIEKLNAQAPGSNYHQQVPKLHRGWIKSLDRIKGFDMIIEGGSATEDRPYGTTAAEALDFGLASLALLHNT
jgi:DNA-directed RNA polymerase subunit RPC12/RpoP